MRKRTSETKRFCKFCLVSKGAKVIHGVYDRESNSLYAVGKNGKPVRKSAYSTPKKFAVAHGCKAALFAQKIFLNGKTLKELCIEGLIFYGLSVMFSRSRACYTLRS